MATRRRKKTRGGRETKGDRARCTGCGYDEEIVFAEKIAEKVRDGSISLEKCRFICPGVNSATGEMCTCNLSLCSYRLENKVPPYFAHKRNDKTTHVENCTYQGESVEVTIIKRAKKSINGFSVTEIINNLLKSGPSKTKTKKGGNGTGGKNISPPPVKRAGKHARKEIVMKEIANSNDLYLALIPLLRNDVSATTKDGIKADNILVNSDTIDEYRTTRKEIAGPKLIVAGTSVVDQTFAEHIRKILGKTCWILEDPYILGENNVKIYYALDFQEDWELRREYLQVIDKASNNGNLVLVLGYAEKIDWHNEDQMVCRIIIKDRKKRQVRILKDNREYKQALE